MFGVSHQMSEGNIDDVQILQNKCIRIMTFAPFDQNVDQSFIDLGLLKVREVIKTNQLKIVRRSPMDSHICHKLSQILLGNPM